MAMFAIFLLVDFALVPPALAATNVNNYFSAGGDGTTGDQFADDAGLAGSGTNLYTTITRVIRWFIGFLGIIAVILIIYGGFLWMTSGGDPQKIDKAKTVLKNAVIGLIIIILAFAIVSFILNLLTGGGGANKKPGVPPGNIGVGALGGGIIESHYPARNQKDVPRNTSIIVTFREAINPTTICSNPTDVNKCNGEEINTDALKNIRIFKLSQHTLCTSATIDPLCTLAQAKAYSTPNKKTFIFVPDSYLGSPSEPIDYGVYLTTGIKKADGKNAFAGSFSQGYEWPFEVSTKIDLTPPQVKVGGVFPAPDVSADSYIVGAATPAAWEIIVAALPEVKKIAEVTSVVSVGGDPAGAVINPSCRQDGILKVIIPAGTTPLVAQLFSPAPASMLMGQGTFGQSAGHKTISFSECNLVLTLSGLSDDFSAGNGWDITVTRAIDADTLTVGNKVYTFVSGSPGNQQILLGAGPNSMSATAYNIYQTLKNNTEVKPIPPFPTKQNLNEFVILEAIVAGSAGNNIVFNTSNSEALKISMEQNGADRPETVTVKGRRDKPMNATIQIEFNEAIMPMQVSGTADEVHDFIRVVNADPAAKPTTANPADLSCTADADCRSFMCDKEELKCKERIVNTNPTTAPAGANCTQDSDCKSLICEGTKCVAANYLKGKFEISNQYSTVNFISDRECGFNSCGEKIYCLPENSHLSVELKAAGLALCDTDADCASKSPYNTCHTTKVCVNPSNENYPQADLMYLMDSVKGGIMDAAINSLDGNRDDLAQGSVSYYNENDLYGLCGNKQCSQADKLTICGVVACSAGSLANAQEKGDNFLWKFFINNLLDLTSPKITLTDPITKAYDFATADYVKPISMHFDKLMMSSRLTTGNVTVTNNKEKVIHQLINLKAYATEPLAYWVTNKGFDKEPRDGEYEESDVFLNHSSFGKARSYRAQAGSGLKDIYQNCYLPSGSLDCAATLIDPAAPSCCNGTPTDSEKCQ